MNPRIAIAAAVSAFGTAYAALPTDDQKFMEDAARAGLAEVDAAKLARQKGESQAVKDFARHMEEDHAKANEELKKLAGSKGVSLPTDVDAKHKRMSAELNKHTAAQFDREYMGQQVNDHKQVVHEFEREAKNGRDADVKKWAADKLPTLRQHLEMAQSTEKGIRKENAPADKQPKNESTGSMKK